MTYSGARLAVAIFFTAFGLVLLVAIIPSIAGDTGQAHLSPRLVPTIAAGFITVCGSLELFQAWKAHYSGIREALGLNIPKVIGALGAIFAVSLLMPYFGFWIAALLSIIVVQLICGERRWLVLTSLPPALVSVVWFLASRLAGLQVL